MKIILEKQEAESMFYNSLCNGLNELSYYGLQLSFFDADYAKAAKKLKETATDLNDVHERVALTPIRHLMDAINEDDDAITADCILQSVFFKEVVFG